LRESAALALVSKEEGFGFPILEAFDFGLPVVASDIPVLREIGADACVYVNPDSLEDIARGLETAVVETHCNAFLQKIEKGHERLKKISWQKTAEKIFKSAQELLKPKIIAEAKPESKEEVVEEKIEEKGIIEEAARVAEKELAEEAREEGIKEGIEESPMEQSGIETEPSAEKEIEEELKPKDFE